MGPKKKFIDKKRATTYSVVHRSAQDGAFGDETNPSEFVLVAQELGLPNDGYDYTQHMAPISKSGTFVRADGQTMPSAAVALPPEALPSDEVAHRDTEAVTLDPETMDPELRRALFDEGDFEELDDDFVGQAQDGQGDDEFDYDAHIQNLLRLAGKEDDEQVDEAFEAVLGEYDDDDDVPDIGVIQLEDRADFFEDMLDDALAKPELDDDKIDPAVKQRILDQEDPDEDVDAALDRTLDAADREREERESRDDCESILSTLSNLDNHPHVLKDEVRRKPPTIHEDRPVDDVPLVHSRSADLPLPPKQKKHEDRVSKAERKKAVKADQREARLRKKQSKLAWAGTNAPGQPPASNAAPGPTHSVFQYS